MGRDNRSNSMFLIALLAKLLVASKAFQLRGESASLDSADISGEKIHLTMLSDRVEGVSVALESICQHTKTPGRLEFYIIGPSQSNGDDDRWALNSLAPTCANGRASIRIFSMETMTTRVKAAGFHPAWLLELGNADPSKYTIHQALWDNSSTHNDPFNLLRFYLPHISPFKKLSQVIFMDDDVIIQGDVAKAWDFKLVGDAVMSASCHNWVWSDCDRFESSTTLSYLDVPYLGFGRLGPSRNSTAALCINDYERECLPEGFLELLADESRKINGEKHAATLENLNQAIAWNYGFNKFDLEAMRKHKITEKYDQWITMNRKYKLFPTTSLAYGLGVPMLVKLGHVQCFDEVTPVIQGLGFVGPKDMRGAGHYAKELESSFGLHFNGPRKPWDVNGGNPYSYIFLKYSQQEQQEKFNVAREQQQEKRKKRAMTNSTSFIVLTDPRSGSEWFMEMLDQHPEICASGEAQDGAEGFPREALIPARYGHMKLINEQLKARELERLAGSTGSLQGPVSLLAINGAHSMGHTVIPNYYTPDAADGQTSIDFRSYGAYAANHHMQSNQYMFSASEVYRAADELKFRQTMKEKIGGFSSCQRKAGCSWGFMAGLVHKVAKEPRFCFGNETDWEARSEKAGFGQHLKMVCHLRENAHTNLKLKQQIVKTRPIELMQEAFKIFFRHQMRESLRLNDAEFGSDLEHRQILPCKCPRAAVITGQKVMHDWIGDLPLAGNAAADWKALPADANYNAVDAKDSLGTPYYDLLGAMKELGTTAVIFERENLLARFVSLEAASQSQIYHCNDPRCVEAAARQSVWVNVTEMRRFVKWNQRMHLRNRELLATEGIPTLSVNYEQCRSDTASCLESVTAFLGVSDPSSDMASAAKSIRLINSLRHQIENLDEVTEALQEDGNERWLD